MAGTSLTFGLDRVWGVELVPDMGCWCRRCARKGGCEGGYLYPGVARVRDTSHKTKNLKVEPDKATTTPVPCLSSCAAQMDTPHVRFMNLL